MTENAVRTDPLSPEPVLLVGAVTWDVVDGERVPGGAVTYAARAATALGVRAYVLVAAGDDADLDAFAEHELAVVRLEQTMRVVLRRRRQVIRETLLRSRRRSSGLSRTSRRQECALYQGRQTQERVRYASVQQNLHRLT